MKPNSNDEVQPAITSTPAPEVNPENKPKKSHKILFFLLGIFIVLIIVGGIGGGYYLGRSSITTELNPSSPAIPPKDPNMYTGSPSPEAMNDETTDWKTYTGNGFSVKYNPAWTANAQNDFGVTSIFDLKSWKDTIGNGGKKVGAPSEYFTVEVKNSPESVKQYVDQALKGPEYTGVNPERKNFTVANLSGEIYKAGGEGSKGFNIVVSNGNKIAVINVPLADPSQNKIYANMLSTFKFTN